MFSYYYYHYTHRENLRFRQVKVKFYLKKEDSTSRLALSHLMISLNINDALYTRDQIYSMEIMEIHSVPEELEGGK